MTSTLLETCLDVEVSRLAASASGRGNRWRVESTRHGRAEGPDLDKTWASRRNRRPSLSWTLGTSDFF